MMLALILGLIVSIGQVIADFSEHQKQVDQKINNMLSLVASPADRAVYLLDQSATEQLVEGFKKFKFLHHVQILNDSKQVMSESLIPLKNSKTRFITDWISQSTKQFNLSLGHSFLTNKPTNPVGELKLTIDNDQLLKPFYGRAIYIFLSGFARNTLLAMALFSFFYIMLTAPFVELAKKFQHIDPAVGNSNLIEHNKKHTHDEFGYIVDSANELISQIMQLNAQLETKVKERTFELNKSNQHLSIALQELKQSQQQLVEKEKMASMGKLVAGVAHELNTPLGIGVTAASLLDKLIVELKKSYQQERLSSKELEDFLETASTSSELLTKNLHRSADLVSSFKKVSVNQTVEQALQIELDLYLHQIIASLSAQLNNKQHKIHIHSDNIKVRMNVDALNQILNNLVCNSLIHGFKNKPQGEITLSATQKNKQIEIVYQDNGCGMNELDLAMLFEPFFTTTRNKGGTGLGAHIVYNLVTQALNGKISAWSRLEQGLTIKITFPM